MGHSLAEYDSDRGFSLGFSFCFCPVQVNHLWGLHRGPSNIPPWVLVALPSPALLSCSFSFSLGFRFWTLTWRPQPSWQRPWCQRWRSEGTDREREPGCSGPHAGWGPGFPLRRGSLSSFSRGGSVVIVASVGAYFPFPVRSPFFATSTRPPAESCIFSTPLVTLTSVCPLLESHHQAPSHKIDALPPKPLT